MVKSNGQENHLNLPSSPSPQGADQNAEELILKAAQEEFISHGMKGARMQKIADRAGVNKSLLHYYYRSKDKLYVAVLESMFSRVWNRLKSNFESRTPSELKDTVETIVTSYIEVFSENPDFPLFLMQELKSGNKYVPAAVNALLPSAQYIKKYLFDEVERIVTVKKANTIPPHPPSLEYHGNDNGHIHHQTHDPDYRAFSGAPGGIQ